MTRPFILSLTFAISGCSVVNIQVASRDEVEVTRGVGMINVQLSPKTRAVVAESTTFGVINSFDGFAAGYHSTVLAAMGEGHCGMVLWIRTNEDLAQLQGLLKERSDVCIARSTSSNKDTP